MELYVNNSCFRPVSYRIVRKKPVSDVWLHTEILLKVCISKGYSHLGLIKLSKLLIPSSR